MISYFSIIIFFSFIYLVMHSDLYNNYRSLVSIIIIQFILVIILMAAGLENNVIGYVVQSVVSIIFLYNVVYGVYYLYSNNDNKTL